MPKWLGTTDVKHTLNKFVCFPLVNLSFVIGISVINLAMDEEKIHFILQFFLSVIWKMRTDFHVHMALQATCRS